MEMTITHALSQLKLLDKRIEKLTEDLQVCLIVQGETYDGEDDFVKKSTGKIKSIVHLIDRRAMIKSKIAESNATTTVTISGKQMTVAAAIELKTSIAYTNDLAAKLTYLLSGATQEVEDRNKAVQRSLESLLEASVGKDDGNSDYAERIKAITDTYRKSNVWRLITPKNLEGTISALRQEIDDFQSEVDWRLSEVNSVTTITVDD